MVRNASKGGAEATTTSLVRNASERRAEKRDDSQVPDANEERKTSRRQERQGRATKLASHRRVVWEDVGDTMPSDACFLSAFTGAAMTTISAGCVHSEYGDTVLATAFLHLEECRPR